MHVLPRVRQLHERFEGLLEVVGVHAGKFPGERRTDRIVQACERLGVHHPVINDRQFRVWHDYAVKAWPTVALIDPEGYLVGVQAGEFDVEAMAAVVEGVIERARKRNKLRPDALREHRPDSVAPVGDTLRFPTRTASEGGALWISDTGNHRVLECAWGVDGPSATVVREYPGFAEPRGLALLDGVAYLADRAGHSIWRLESGARELVAGTGEIADFRIELGPATERALRSPWGLAAYDGGLAVAMAGSHQMWHLELAGGTLSLLAGRGAEEVLDGRGSQALLAQPTGVSHSSGLLGFADCESSAVRLLEGAESEPLVTTVVGTGLFDFGDVDGTGDEVRLQHCEDVAWHRGDLAVADTYNDRLKRVDSRLRTCSKWSGDAGEGAALREPAGVASVDGGLLVCDTGNHRLVMVDGEGNLENVRLA
ncbi:MAG TPA: alkyl hydroperoxide reductase [Coriobacteriia bacterium]|nr:alkyl hydroperoxide reductase [Coriobacteriia bacterium]